jgi:hypothetical protein
MSDWVKTTKSMPPPHQQVLIRLRESPGGEVCDVACYVGKLPDGEDRWILADVRLDTRQIVEWAHIFPTPPDDMIADFENQIRLLQAKIKELEAQLSEATRP